MTQTVCPVVHALLQWKRGTYNINTEVEKSAHSSKYCCTAVHARREVAQGHNVGTLAPYNTYNGDVLPAPSPAND